MAHCVHTQTLTRKGRLKLAAREPILLLTHIAYNVNVQ